MKTCPSCKQEYPLDNFYNRAHSPDGKDTYCKICKRAMVKDYRERNLDVIRSRHREHYHTKPGRKRHVRNYMLLRTYNITVDDYDEMYKKQNGKCKICSNETILVVDHDHDTGRIRGLLCQNCNRALGLMGDSIESLVNAIDHLQENNLNENVLQM